MGPRFARFLLRFVMRLLTRIKIEGIEHLPHSGSYVVAANHVGRMDVPLVYDLLNRDDIILLVAEKYKEIAFFRWMAQQFDAVWIDRFNADFHALRSALARLKAGGVLVLAPEGTRSQTGQLIEAHDGASWLAIKGEKPVIPVALMGTEDSVVVSRLRRLRRLNITIRLGNPIMPPQLKGPNREEIIKGFTDEIMCQIAALLPPASRGFYANHPRLQEILSTSKNGNAPANNF